MPSLLTVECIEWDEWVNVGKPSPDVPGDYEPIDEVITQSPTCKNPVDIECRRKTDGRPWDQTGLYYL